MIADRDPAESSMASTEDHPADHYLEAFCPRCEHPVDAVCPSCRSNVEPADIELNPGKGTILAAAEFHRRLIMLLVESRNTKFTMQCYLIASGDGAAEGKSEAELAKEWGVGRATVSKHCRRICLLLGMPPSRSMRSDETAEGFKDGNWKPIKAAV